MTGTGRFLIVTWDGGGNVPPAVNLGARLIRRGHEVRVLTVVTSALLPPGHTLDDHWAELVDPKLHGDGTVEEILTVADSFRPDVLVIDCMLGAGYAAAVKLGLPTAVLVHVQYGPFVNVWGDGLMHASTLGLLSGADLVLALTAPEFDDVPEPLPDNTIFVGPVLAPAADIVEPGLPELSQPGHPWVLVSLSTTAQHQEEALPAILEAVGALPVRVLLTLGGVLPVESVTVAGNVTVRSFVPHESVLPNMAAVVCHAGLSTITTSLAHGVPLLCIPQGRDQPRNAERVAALGVGQAVAPDATGSEIADALCQVLNEGVIRAAARRFVAPDSGARAAEHVECLLGSGTLSGPEVPPLG
jgi:UDP:flavonoid glycosyltransferase YjiC (YdhE family)